MAEWIIKNGKIVDNTKTISIDDVNAFNTKDNAPIVPFWEFDNTNAINKLIPFAQCPTPFDGEGPAALWIIRNGRIAKGVEKENPIGACCHSTRLTKVTMPSTLQYIGVESFTYSGLTNVTIPQGCEYKSTTFPKNCIITHK